MDLAEEVFLPVIDRSELFCVDVLFAGSAF
jgi:hypothetical protein